MTFIDIQGTHINPANVTYTRIAKNKPKVLEVFLVSHETLEFEFPKEGEARKALKKLVTSSPASSV
jgi:hypothetical protein